MRKYGMPYKGSKAAIADFVIAYLPPGGTLVDLFCGGCAVTHAALLSGKWDKVIANDIHVDVPQLFLDAIHGKYTTENERRWISREDFFALKDTDAYVRLCWSFRNDGRTYMYSREIEPLKHAMHEVVFGCTVYDRMLAMRRLMRLIRTHDYNLLSTKHLQSLDGLMRLESLESLARLARLESLQEIELEVSGKDYREVDIPEDAVIYCDIPYGGTTRKNEYGIRFDRSAFLNWACEQRNPIIISEYNIEDDRFAIVAETQRIQLSAGAIYQKKVTERLYCPKQQYKAIMERINA